MAAWKLPCEVASWIVQMSAVLDRQFASRWFLNDVRRCDGHVTIFGRGSGFPPFDPVFTRKVEGAGLEQVGDPDYRAWVASSLADVAATGEARFDDVDAIVGWPRLGDIRTRYWRLMTPILDLGNGLCRVLAASGNDSGIDLRPEYVKKPGEVDGGIVSVHPYQHSLG